MRGMGRMKDNGHPIQWGPGRHGPGNNVFAYFCGPDEVPLEYAAEVQQSTTATSRGRPTTGNFRPAAPISGASPSRARRAIIGCSGCSALQRTAIGSVERAEHGQKAQAKDTSASVDRKAVR